MIEFVDRELVNPRKRILRNTETNEIINVEIQDDPNNLITGGTLLNAENFNENFNELNENKVEIETITNENGTAIKFSDGTMICTLNKTVTNLSISNVYGDIFIGTWEWVFPVAFETYPVVSCGQMLWGTGASWGTSLQPTKTSVNLRAFDYFSRNAGTNSYIQATAIGRWK